MCQIWSMTLHFADKLGFELTTKKMTQNLTVGMQVLHTNTLRSTHFHCRTHFCWRCKLMIPPTMAQIAWSKCFSRMHVRVMCYTDVRRTGWQELVNRNQEADFAKALAGDCSCGWWGFCYDSYWGIENRGDVIPYSRHETLCDRNSFKYCGQGREHGGLYYTGPQRDVCFETRDTRNSVARVKLEATTALKSNVQQCNWCNILSDTTSGTGTSLLLRWEAERQGVAAFQIMRKKFCESYNQLRRQHVAISNAGGDYLPVRCAGETARLHGCLTSASTRAAMDNASTTVGETPHPKVHVCVCICMCVHTCVCVCMCVHLCASLCAVYNCIHMYPCECLCPCVYMHLCMWIPAYMYVCMYYATYVYMHACMNVCMHLCMYAWTHVYMSICVCVHVVCTCLCTIVCVCFNLCVYVCGYVYMICMYVNCCACVCVCV